jgi:hypothetical protein
VGVGVGVGDGGTVVEVVLVEVEVLLEVDDVLLVLEVLDELELLVLEVEDDVELLVTVVVVVDGGGRVVLVIVELEVDELLVELEVVLVELVVVVGVPQQPEPVGAKETGRTFSPTCFSQHKCADGRTRPAAVRAKAETTFPLLQPHCLNYAEYS